MKPRYNDRQIHDLSAQYFDKFVVRDLQEIRKNLFSDLENKFEIDLRLAPFLKEPEVLHLLQKIERKQVYIYSLKN